MFNKSLFDIDKTLIENVLIANIMELYNTDFM